jgi:hypothetical protein
MKIMVNGCSVSRGPGSWPYVIKQRIGCELVNLSQAGAGNTYICDATIDELSKRKYDLVMIMWADHRRYDLKVKNINDFTDTIYTSKFQKTCNDWPEKIVYPQNDQDLVDDNWVFGCGYLNTKDPSIVGLFDSYYQHTNLESQYFSSYMKIIALQSFLKTTNQPYIFCSVRKFTNMQKITNLYNLLDFDRIYNDVTAHDLAGELDDWEQDRLHPGPWAHTKYADHLVEFSQRKGLFNEHH